ncbi:MAG TPA: hypothetical protein G4O00_03285 [Thermoflexia bacterium]|nr:hypothetical protein [Thermoflexia bacterium]
MKRSWSKGARIGLWILLFIAYALRVGSLTLQSLWVDEGYALYFTDGNFLKVMHTIVQPQHNGPLFYFLLFWWRRIAGDSDFAIRYLSVMFNVLTLPLLFRWAKRLFTKRTALTACWLFAFSPFSLWFAQEAKMYALHMMVATGSSLVLTEAFLRGRWWRWALYALLTSTVLYSHFFGAFLVATQLGMALLLGWSRRRRLAAYFITMLLLGLAHTPLIKFGWLVLRYYEPRDLWRGFVPLGTMVRDAVGNYFYRLSAPLISWTAFLLPTGLALAGVAALLRLHQRRERWIIVLQATAPVLIFYPISFRAPVYAAKYLSAVVPALFILAAFGIESLARLWRPLGLLLLALGMLMTNGIVRDLTDPTVQRADWRFVAEYLETHEGPNDIVVVSAFYNTYLLNRYYRGQSKVWGFEADPYNPGPVYQEFGEKYDHIWLVLHHDQAMAPGNRLREAAIEAFPIITEQYPNGGQIAVIGLQARFAYPNLPSTATPMDSCFANGICLVGYWLDARSLPPTEDLSHPPSNWIHIVLYWRREPKIDPTPFRPLVRLVDAGFEVWGGNLDRQPDLFDRYPPDQWDANEVVETHFDLNLNPATPPGMYKLEVSLALEGAENRRVELVNPAFGQPPDRVLFERIQILPGD